MVKKSIDKEFAGKAEKLRIAGMSEYQVVEELSKEYYDKRQVSNTLYRIVHPDDREELLSQKKVLCVLGLIAILIGIVEIYFTINISAFKVSLETIDFGMFTEIFFAIGLLIEWIPALRFQKISYKFNIFLSSMLIITNVSIVFVEESFLMWTGLLQTITWLAVFALNIIWLRKGKK